MAQQKQVTVAHKSINFFNGGKLHNDAIVLMPRRKQVTVAIKSLFIFLPFNGEKRYTPRCRRRCGRFLPRKTEQVTVANGKTIYNF